MRLLIFVFVIGIVMPLASGIDMDLTGDTIRNTVRDFVNELSGIQSDAIGNNNRRGLLSIQDAFGGIKLDDVDIDVDLSDFVEGLLSTSIDDFVSEIPKSNEGWEAELKQKFDEFCSEPQKTTGDVLLQSCSGPEITFELVPGVCRVLDRTHNEFDCDPPRLVYRRSGPLCTSSYREPATFVDKECKFVKQMGKEKRLYLGGGTKDTSLKFGKQKFDEKPKFDISEIVDVVSGLFSDLGDYPDLSSLFSSN